MTESMIFQVQGYVTKITTMAAGLRIIFDTMETLSDDARGRLFALYNKPGWMTVNVHQIEAQDVVNLPPVKSDPGKKTPSQRLRAVLWQVWNQDNKGFKDFEGYYTAMMEKLIDHYKGMLA